MMPPFPIAGSLLDHRTEVDPAPFRDRLKGNTTILKEGERYLCLLQFAIRNLVAFVLESLSVGLEIP